MLNFDFFFLLASATQTPHHDVQSTTPRNWTT